MSNNPLISIIIPVYNLEKYIGKTFESVLEQTYKNIEIIAVDDGSTDNSFEIIKRYAKRDKRIIPVHQENSGVVSARRNGVSRANGEYIGFVDGDDLIDSDMYEFLLKNIVEENADISHCGYVMHIGERLDYYYETGKYIVQDNLTGITDLISGAFIEPGLVNKLYRKELIISAINNSNIEGLRYLEDLLINYYAFKLSKKAVYVDKCKYHYMVRSNSASTSQINDAKFYDPIRVFKTIRKDSDYEIIKNISYRRMIGKLLSASTETFSIETNIEVKKMLKSEVKNVIKTSALSKKSKVMFLFTTYFNSVYKLIRKIYCKVTKADSKYKV